MISTIKYIFHVQNKRVRRLPSHGLFQLVHTIQLLCDCDAFINSMQLYNIMQEPIY